MTTVVKIHIATQHEGMLQLVVGPLHLVDSLHNAAYILMSTMVHCMKSIQNNRIQSTSQLCWLDL